MFKYLLSINEIKYPEVCAKLEKAKEKDGIASYIRQLIEKDLQSTPMKITQPALSEIAASSEMSWPEEVQIQAKPAKPKREAAAIIVNDMDDFGGGLV